MKRLGPILGVLVLAIVVGAGVTFLLGADPLSSSAEPIAEGDPELTGGYGGLGGSGASRGGPSAEMPSLDAGVGAGDGGEGAPIPLYPPREPSSASHLVEPPRELPASITFPHPRTVEDEYESANMIWSMIEARREGVRADLAEARRTGDQQLSARLAHQLELLEIADHRTEGQVRELESRRTVTAPEPEEDTAHAPSSEGSAPE